MDPEIFDKVRTEKIENVHANKGTLMGLLRNIAAYKGPQQRDHNMQIVVSSDDEFFKPSAYGIQYLQHRLPNASITQIPNATHNWIAYEPQKAAKLTSDFLK